MNVRYSNKRILFIHIPKCAGTSVTDALKYKDALWFDKTNDRHQSIIKYNSQSYDYIFSVVRNPYSRLVSFYHYILQDPHQQTVQKNSIIREFKTFKGWLLNGCPGLWPEQSSYIDEKVDIYKIENIASNWNTILERCGVPWYHRLHMGLKHTNKSRHAEYKKYYDTLELKLTARSLLRDDIKYLGYEYL